jgi:hypothetical protein
VIFPIEGARCDNHATRLRAALGGLVTATGRLSTVALLVLGVLALSPTGLVSAQPTPGSGAPTPSTTAPRPAPTPAAPAPTTAPTTSPTPPPTTPAPTTTPTTTPPATPPTTPPPTTTPPATPPPATPPTATPPAPTPAPTPTPPPGPVADAGDGGKAIPPPPPPTPEQLEKAKAAFAAGKKAFDDKQLDVAVEKFKESYRLSRNPLLLYNIGFTFDQMGLKDKALFYYQKFLSDAPQEAGQRAEVTARAKVLEAELAAAADTGENTAEPTTGGRKPPRPTRTFDIAEFDHQVIEEAPPGKPLDLTAYVPEDSGWQVTMFYRAGGDARFTSVAMRSRYNELVGRVPATKMQGVSIQYYLEVRTPDGKVLTRVGKPGSPNIVYLEPKARPRYYPDLEDENGAFIEVGPVVGPAGPRSRGDGLRDGGYFEVGTRQFRRGKWIATGTSAVLLGTSLAFYLMAAGNSSALEGEAATANDPSHCGAAPKPCETFGSYGRSLQSVGKRNELVSRITLGVSAAAVGIAAYYWYKDVKAARKAERAAAAAPPPASGLSSLIVVPAADDGYLGGTAALRF